MPVEVDFGGFESGPIEDGWIIPTGGYSVTPGTGYTNARGVGGSIAAVPIGTAAMTYAFTAREAKRFAFRQSLVTGTGSPAIVTWFNGSTEMGSLRRNATSGKLELYTGTSTLVATSNAAINQTTWYHFTVYVYIADAGGFIKVYLDNDLVTAFVEFSGDTKPSTQTQIDMIKLSTLTGTVTDDWWCTTLSLKYDTDNGLGTAWAAGQTVTGATSGASAKISSVDTVSGRLFLYNWNGTAFQNNEVISNATSRTALVDAP